MIIKLVPIIVLFFTLFLNRSSAQKPFIDTAKQHHDFSNTTQISLAGLSHVYVKLQKTTLVVLNKKEIISIDSKTFRQLTNESIVSIDIIDDKQSKMDIKTIIFIQTK